MSAEQMRCLVTGATGYIGGRLVPRLLESGFTVRALARNPDKLANVPWRNKAEVARGDLNDVASLEAAFTDVDVVYYLVHSMGLEKDFSTEERRAAQNVVSAARAAGVRRIVYLSGLHPEGVELSTHLTSRTTVGEILIASGIETIVLQAGVVVGSGSASFEMIRHLTDRLPVMTTPTFFDGKGTISIALPLARHRASSFLSLASAIYNGIIFVPATVSPDWQTVLVCCVAKIISLIAFICCNRGMFTLSRPRDFALTLTRPSDGWVNSKASPAAASAILRAASSS